MAFRTDNRSWNRRGEVLKSFERWWSWLSSRERVGFGERTEMTATSRTRSNSSRR